MKGSMTGALRCSPVSFSAKPKNTDIRDQWTVVLEYENEGAGPYIIDLSHRTKWDVQDGHITAISPLGISIPEVPGRCVYQKGALINRLNRTQASVWHIGKDRSNMPSHSAYTDVTDVFMLAAILGKREIVHGIMEKLAALDLDIAESDTPCLLQGPVCHVPCQVVNFGTINQDTLVLIACSRGYARDMVHGVLEAGEEWGIAPAGEHRLKME